MPSRTGPRSSSVPIQDSDPDPRALVELAVSVAGEAAELALAVRERVTAGRLDTKSSETDVVTEGDTACEDLVRRRLAEQRPGDVVMGEEGGQQEPAQHEGGRPEPGGARVRWIVDPIDGTVNYTHGLAWYSVSLGAEIDGRTVAGAVVEPVSGRVWSAAAGHGAFCDGRPLRASRLERLDLAVVGTGFSYDRDRRERQAALFARLAGRVGDIRRTGSAALDLCAVAAGWVDAFYEHGLNAWDLAAGALIAEEAGALVRRPREAGEAAGRGRAGGRGGAAGAGDDGLGDDLTLAAPPALAGPLAELLRSCGAAEI